MSNTACESHRTECRKEIFGAINARPKWVYVAFIIGGLGTILGTLIFLTYGAAGNAMDHATNNEVSLARVEQKVISIHEDQREIKADIKELLKEAKK